jgi:hypothetical protein
MSTTEQTGSEARIRLDRCPSRERLTRTIKDNNQPIQLSTDVSEGGRVQCPERVQGGSALHKFLMLFKLVAEAVWPRV